MYIGGKKLNNLNYILKLIKNNKLAIIFSIIFANLAVVFSMLNPILIKYIVDVIIGSEKIKSDEYLIKFVDYIVNLFSTENKIVLVGSIIILFTIFQGLFSYIKEFLAVKVAQKSSKRIREKLFRKIEELPYDYHVNAKTGDVIQRCTSDVETAQDFVSDQLSNFAQLIFTVFYSLTIMCILNFKYTLISVILIPVIFVYTLRFFLMMQKIFKGADEAEGRLTNVVQESITGIRVVRAFAAEKSEIEKFDEQNTEYKEKIYDLIKLMSKFWSLSDFLCIGQFSIIIIAGIYLASYNIVSIGTVIAFSSYAGMMIWPIRQFGQVAASTGQAFVALKRINEVLDETSENYSDSKLKPEVKGKIEFNNFKFRYPKGNEILDNISFLIKEGETVAFMGETGCGKSTIAHILLRLYDYKEGSVKIDGNELKSIDRRWIRDNVSIVLQEPYLFSQNIENNIKIAKPKANLKEVKTYAKKAYIHESIKSFKDKYKTMVGEKGITLSGGQKQRVAIARALIKNSPILIFDDSLSALDTETDSKIREALKYDNVKRTTIIISHRITSVMEADRIFVLDNKNIVETGTHDELIKKEGIYNNLFNIQAKLKDENELVGV
jgi:ATP-binding cassette subfamily B protein